MKTPVYKLKMRGGKWVLLERKLSMHGFWTPVIEHDSEDFIRAYAHVKGYDV